MINISDNFQFIINALKDNSKNLQKEANYFINEQGEEQSKFIVQILKENKQKTDMVANRLEKNFESHCNLVMLTDDELDKLCGG
jgi:hypothetical protein